MRELCSLRELIPRAGLEKIDFAMRKLWPFTSLFFLLCNSGISGLNTPGLFCIDTDLDEVNRFRKVVDDGTLFILFIIFLFL